MAITHKGIAMLLKHNGLDPESSNDGDVKTCVDAAIKNSDAAGSDESDMEDESEDSDIENRAEADEALITENAELKAKLAKFERGEKKPVHVPNRAKTPDVDIDSDLLADQAEEEEAIVIRNRAKQLKDEGTPGATAWIMAARESNAKKKK